MASKIFCVGFSKTGTTSLEKALQILGYNVCKGNYANNYSNYLMALAIHKDLEELYKIISYYDAFVDAPWGGSELYKQLCVDFPNGKFILTTRNVDDWYNSLEKMFCQFSVNKEHCLEDFHKNGRYGFVYFFKTVFNISTLKNNEKKIKETYIKYNNSVIDYFERNKINYLQIDINDNDKWDKICSFLNKHKPDIPFPHENKAKQKKTENQSPIIKFINKLKK